MTADVIAIVSLVLRKLSDLTAEEARFLSGVADDMKWIQRELMTLQSSLNDADDAKHKKNEGARNWVKQVREIAYDAEDIIDYFIGQVAIRGADRQGLLGPIRRLASYPNELLTDHAIGVQIQTIKSRISDLSSDRQTFGINAINQGGGGQEPSSSWDLHQCRRRRAHQDELDIFGIQDAMESLKDRLLDGDPNRCVVSIVGMGGSGKTTLARKVYHEVKDEFNCHAFIYVSQHYTCKEILTRLIKSVMVPKPETEEIEKLSNQELEDKLRYYLSGKRYLVVIDDIWSKDAWDEFLFVLPQGSKESRVMLTTRNKVVAARADPSPHETRLLNDDEGWKLFLSKAFPWENAPFVCPELEKIGRDIFAKCHGLPLAIVLLGGLLSTKDKQLHQWSRVLDNVTKRLAESSNELMELMEILALSYSDLPSYLKHCFLYFGLFRPSRKDEISSKKLIRLWIAEGLCEEDRADDYLEELINRSMIQVVTRRIDGSIRTCRIHDLLSDLSISEAKENNFFAIQADNGTIEGLSSVRRLALSCVTKMNEAINCPIATLRSMLCFSNDAMDLSKLLSSRGVKVLRVLEILPSQKLPQNIGNFVNLRYLSLRGEAIKRLPSSICRLSKLLAYAHITMLLMGAHD